MYYKHIFSKIRIKLPSFLKLRLPHFGNRHQSLPGILLPLQTFASLLCHKYQLQEHGIAVLQWSYAFYGTIKHYYGI